MSATDLKALAMKARANSERWFPSVHDPRQATLPLSVHYALGLAGEVGEVANLFKKLCREHKNRKHLAKFQGAPKMAGELADVFTYLILLADEVGIDLVAAFESKQVECERRWGTPLATQD